MEEIKKEGRISQKITRASRMREVEESRERETRTAHSRLGVRGCTGKRNHSWPDWTGRMRVPSTLILRCGKLRPLPCAVVF